MSTSKTLRIPIEIPDDIKDSNYRIQFSVEQTGSSDGCAIFLDEMGPSDLLNGSNPQEKIAVIRRSDLPGFKDDSPPKALKVSCVIY